MNPDNICCWWCCHPFETVPLHLPVSYNDKSRSFEVYGHFCSFSCMKAYNKNDNSSSKNNRCTLINMMIQQSTKNSESITIAPPRESLKMFGGDMSIDTFRHHCKAGNVYNNLLPPYISLKTITDTRQSYANYQWIKKEENNQAPDTSKQKTYINNPLKIKGDNKKTNTLEKIFGIN